MLNNGIFSTAFVEKEKTKIFPQIFYPHSTGLVEKSETGVDIGGNIPNVILQGGVLTLERQFNFTNGVNDG